MTEQTRQSFETTVLRRLRGLGRRLRFYLFMDGLAVVSVAILAAMLITFVVDRTFWLAHDMRLVQLISLLLALAGIAWWYIARPLSVRVRDVDLALLVERSFPHLESRLVSAVDFHAGAVGTGTAASAPMIERTVRDAEAGVADLDFAKTLSARRFGRRATVTLGCLILFALVTASARETTRLWFQRNVLLRDVQWPIRNRMIVEGLKDGVMIVPRGDDVTVSAVVEEGYAPPRQCYVQFESEDRHRGREQMPAILSESQGAPVRFTHTFERINQTLTCRIVGGDFRSDPFVLRVVDRPRVAQVVIGITPPDYTRLEAYELRAGQTVAEALKGSRIRLRIATNKPLASAALVRQSGGQEQEVARADRLGELEYLATDLPEASASYYFRMEDTIGLGNISDRTPPLRVSLRLVSDKPPSVKMRIRGVGDMITTAAVLPIEAEFSDVYGLASAELVHSLSREGSTPGVERLAGFEPGSKVFSRTLDWAAPAHGVAEGDRVTLLAAATDFDTISGPNRGESSALVLRVVSREELMAELNRREQEYRQDFERLLSQQEELYGELLSLAGNLGTSAGDASRRLGQLARLQRDFGGRANGLRLQFEQILSELRINQLSSAAAEARLGGGIVEPMTFLSRTRMPVAAEQLEALGRETTAGNMQLARGTQAELIAEMQRILTAMLKWEGFQEAVSLLREVLKLQGNLSQETEKRIEAEIFGIGSQTAPSN